MCYKSTLLDTQCDQSLHRSVHLPVIEGQHLTLILATVYGLSCRKRNVHNTIEQSQSSARVSQRSLRQLTKLREATSEGRGLLFRSHFGGQCSNMKQPYRHRNVMRVDYGSREHLDHA